MKYRNHPLCLALLSAALCMGACGKTEETPESEPVETEAAATEDIHEEEQVRMVYEEGLKMTFCIFTPGGNNGTGKLVEPDEGFRRQIDALNQFITSDADLILGYSGGPVFNLSGQLIGISNAAFTGDLSQYGFEHLSLIIPINRVRAEIEENCKG